MNDSTYMTRYLLGELSDEERAALEEQYVCDPRVFDEVAKAESDLVDDYVRGKLAPEARAQFERVYLADPHRRERVTFAEALLNRLDRTPGPELVGAAPSAAVGFAWRTWLNELLRPKPVLGVAFATLVIVAGVWLAFEARRARQDAVQREAARTDQERRDREADRRVAAERARADQAAPARPPTVVVLAISIGTGVRSVDTSAPIPLAMTADTSEVRLQLSLRQLDYPSYRVIVRNVGGAETFRRVGLTPSAAGSRADITVDVPANAFESGDYLLILQGASGSGGFEDVSRSLIRADKR